MGNEDRRGQSASGGVLRKETGKSTGIKGVRGEGIDPFYQWFGGSGTKPNFFL